MSNDNILALQRQLLSGNHGNWKQIFTYNHFMMIIHEPDVDNYTTDSVIGLSFEPPHVCFVELGRNPIEILKQRLTDSGNAVMVDVLCKNVNEQDGLVYVPTKTLAAVRADDIEIQGQTLQFKTGEIIWQQPL